MKKLFALLCLVSAPSFGQHLFTPNEMPEAWCLALNIYHEARGSSYADQVAVSDVVLNRVKDTRYPNTICEVVKQANRRWDGSLVKGKCSFSWYCDGKSDWPMEKESFIKAQSLALKMWTFGEYRGITEGATHYHADYIEGPNWVKEMQLVGRIGSHIYYRWD